MPKYQTKIFLGFNSGLDLSGGVCMHRSLDRFAKHTQTTFTFMVLHLLFTICTTAHGTHWLHKHFTHILHTLNKVNIAHLLHCKSHEFAAMALQFQDADYICIPVSASGNLFECSGNYEREYCKN